MQPKFTPGPWVRHVSDPRHGDRLAVLVFTAGNGGDLIADCRGTGNDMYEDVANAALIAAAPDMYEALCSAAALLREYFAPDDPIVRPTYIAAEAALAKAEGKTDERR